MRSTCFVETRGNQAVQLTKVGLVLVPVGAHSGVAGLEEHLVQVQDERVAQQGAHRPDHLLRERQRAEERALPIHRAELQVLERLRGGLPIAIRGDVAQEALPLQPLHFGLGLLDLGGELRIDVWPLLARSAHRPNLPTFSANFADRLL